MPAQQVWLKKSPIPLFYINNWLAHFSNVAIQSMVHSPFSN